jgi:HAMP domain-containing protein
MIIQCGNCQKKYKIDPTKMKSDTAFFQCKQCGEKISVARDSADIPSDVVPPTSQPSPDPIVETPAAPTPDPIVETPAATTPAMSPNQSPSSRHRFGLNAKMLLLFFFIPLCLVVVASGLYLWQLDTLTKKISEDSYTIVERLSHELVNDTARMVSNQCKLYLDAHPDLKKEEFNQDIEFKTLALQTVGETGYTCIYAVPGPDGSSGVWVHPNEKIVGVDLPPAMKKAMGPQYQAWMKIYQGAYNGDVSSGYYKWKEKDGSIRDKYMNCTPVKGTPYVVAATTYVDEINRDVAKLKLTANQMTHRTRTIVLGVFGITLGLMGGIVFFYSRRLRANLMTLIVAAEKISIGELDTEINVETKDEISDLAEMISRMQQSIRLSIERLRRRR